MNPEHHELVLSEIRWSSHKTWTWGYALVRHTYYLIIKHWLIA